MARPRRNIGRRNNRANSVRNSRANENVHQRTQRNEAVRQRNEHVRAIQLGRNLNRAAFNYNPDMPYSLHKSVVIGIMSKICRYCKAYKFKTEAPGLCCANGKVKLPALNRPPEPLCALVSGVTPLSKHFLTNIQIYNSMFQMTSFGATNIIRDNLLPNFKVISEYDLICDET